MDKSNENNLCNHSFGEITESTDGVFFIDCELCEKRVRMTDEQSEEFMKFRESMCQKCKSNTADCGDLCKRCDGIYKILEATRTEESW